MLPAFAYDDAYITLASAEALIRGRDPAYPTASALDGVTSPFHVVVTAVLATAMPSLWALWLSCLIGAALFALGLQRLAADLQLPPKYQAAFVLAGLGTGTTAAHLLNGLETSWAMAAVAWSLHYAGRDRPRTLGVICGVMPFVRPELGLWSAALIAHTLFVHRRSGQLSLVAAAVSASPWLALLYLQTGGLLPTSFAAKRYWFAEACWPLKHQLAALGWGTLSWALLSAGTLPGAYGLLRSPLGRISAAFIMATLIVWGVTLPGLLGGYHQHRYLTPLAVFLLFGISRLPERWRRIGCVIAAAAAIPGAYLALDFQHRATTEMTATRSELVDVLRSSGATTLMVHDAGFLAWSRSAPTLVDMVGLKTPRAAELHRQFTLPTCGRDRARAIAEIARETGVRHLLVWTDWDHAFGVTSGLTRNGWHVVERARTSEPEVIVLYELQPPGGFGKL